MALAIGDRAPDFNLPGVDGRNYALADFAGKPALVIIWSCNHCPMVVRYEDRMVELQRDYADRGVQVVAINSNDVARYPDDSFERMVERARDKGFPFPYLRDESQQVARAYGPAVTPEVFLFDAKRKLVYHGRIDDNPDDPSAVRRRDLREALEALLAGAPIATAETNAVGCGVKWK
jgi:peroxiredoxin